MKHFNRLGGYELMFMGEYIKFVFLFESTRDLSRFVRVARAYCIAYVMRHDLRVASFCGENEIVAEEGNAGANGEDAVEVMGD
jgi:hypothetical protein